MGNPAILPLTERSKRALDAFTDTEQFPSLSSLERNAFEHFFRLGFEDAAQGKPAKSDWSEPGDDQPAVSFNRDSYRAGYGQGELSR